MKPEQSLPNIKGSELTKSLNRKLKTRVLLNDGRKDHQDWPGFLTTEDPGS